MRVRTAVAAIAVPLLMLLGTASAMPAMADGGSGSTRGSVQEPPKLALEVSDPQVAAEVAAWKAGVMAKMGSSGKIVSFKSAAYEPVVKPTGKAAIAAAYAPGCGLWVIVYKSTSYVAEIGSSLTDCSAPVGTIKHQQYLYRLDWWGFNQKAQASTTVYNTKQLAKDISNHCTNNDSNTWKTTTRGDIWSAGQTWFANVYDDGVFPCGGT